jgi:hypothetical protein
MYPRRIRPHVPSAFFFWKILPISAAHNVSPCGASRYVHRTHIGTAPPALIFIFFDLISSSQPHNPLPNHTHTGSTASYHRTTRRRSSTRPCVDDGESTAATQVCSLHRRAKRSRVAVKGLLPPTSSRWSHEEEEPRCRVRRELLQAAVGERDARRAPPGRRRRARRSEGILEDTVDGSWPGRRRRARGRRCIAVLKEDSSWPTSTRVTRGGLLQDAVDRHATNTPTTSTSARLPGCRRALLFSPSFSKVWIPLQFILWILHLNQYLAIRQK